MRGDLLEPHEVSSRTTHDSVQSRVTHLMFQQSGIFCNMVFRPTSNTGKACNILKCLLEEKLHRMYSCCIALVWELHRSFPRHADTEACRAQWAYDYSVLSHASGPSLGGTVRTSEARCCSLLLAVLHSLGISVPGPRIEPGPQKVPSPDHWHDGNSRVLSETEDK